MLSTNKWYHRKVADKSARPCWICYKLSSSVLITPDDKDFFYVCPGHLKDNKFCQPDADELASIGERKHKWEVDREVQRIETEHADEIAKAKEKQREKEEKEKEKEEEKENKKKDKKKGNDDDGKDDRDSKKDATTKEKESNEGKETKREGNSKRDVPAVFNEEPRIFSLNRNFYQMRIERIRSAELAKRNVDRLQTPGAFPSVPSGTP